ncbi:HAD family hydrolase [Nocardia mexicana]|uniref:Putative hydrolase of the HAD superfamily n=1 Tax=Nocardia mexicana TaxID=279262 RepID=A0A370GRY4_9NOCA|nr:HAD family phosphatase [Nocardia mexicana]RDI45254.1 putative hydrolase of the HAD superfamily [Nocardia mexicana]
MGRNKIAAVWTDFGGVLTPPISHTMGTFCAARGIDVAVLMAAVGKVTARYGTEDIMEPLDTPLVAEDVWLAQVDEVLAADHNVRLGLSTLADAWFDGRETNHEWVAALRTLRASGVFVGLVSNMVPTWDTHWRRMVDVAELFDDVLLSFRVGHRKPQRQMFDLAAERAGVPPQQCLLVDDIEDNCAGAEAAGWRAVVFGDAHQALAEIEPMLQSPISNGAVS